jgi:hypothetical protein
MRLIFHLQMNVVPRLLKVFTRIRLKITTFFIAWKNVILTYIGSKSENFQHHIDNISKSQIKNIVESGTLETQNNDNQASPRKTKKVVQGKTLKDTKLDMVTINQKIKMPSLTGVPKEEKEEKAENVREMPHSENYDHQENQPLSKSNADDNSPLEQSTIKIDTKSGSPLKRKHSNSPKELFESAKKKQKKRRNREPRGGYGGCSVG